MVRSLFISLSLTLVLSCTSNNNKYQIQNCYNKSVDEEAPPKVLYLEEKTKKELKQITVYESYVLTITAIMSNDIIAMVASGEEIDSFEFTDKNDKLFIDLQRLLGTAKIDSAMQIGDVKIDSIYEDVLVRNDAKGYIIDNGLYTYIIPTTDPEYEVYKKGMFKDIALNDTATKKKLVLVSYLTVFYYH